MVAERKLFCIFSLLLLAVCPMLAAAQPNGDERERIRQMVGDVLKEISEADQKIAENKNDTAWLHTERGKLYVKLYRTRYLTEYLSAYYGEKTPGLSVSEITTKAIEDFNRAARKTVSPELLKLRGEMYAIRWFNFAASFRWSNRIENYTRAEIEKKYGKEWSDLVEKIKNDDEILRQKGEAVVLEEFLANKDFESAREDFEAALKIEAISGLAEEIHENLGRLFITRAGQVNRVEMNRNLLIRPNRRSYSILDDLDRGISHLRKAGDLDKDRASGDIIRHTFYEDFVRSDAYWYKLPPLRTALYLKALILSAFGSDAPALKTLNETEKLIDKNAQDGFVCKFYPFRSRVNARMKNFDAALTDANVTVGGNNRNCDGEAYETRGDVYFERGDYREAIKNYTEFINAGGDRRKSEIYEKRATAYLKSGDTKNAISDLTNALENYYYLGSPVENTKRKIETLKFRQSLYRQIGDEKNAVKSEEAIESKIRQLKYSLNARYIFGKITMPDGQQIDRNSVVAVLVYDNDKYKFGKPIVNEKGQFDLTVLKDEPFYLEITFDTVKNKIPVRYYGRSEKFGRGNKLFGPVVIRLDKFVEQNSN